MTDQNKILIDSMKYIMGVKSPSNIIKDKQAYIELGTIEKVIGVYNQII